MKPPTPKEFDEVLWPRSIKDLVKLLTLLGEFGFGEPGSDEPAVEAFTFFFNEVMDEQNRAATLLVACISTIQAFIAAMNRDHGEHDVEFYLGLLDIVEEAEGVE